MAGPISITRRQALKAGATTGLALFAVACGGTGDTAPPAESQFGVYLTIRSDDQILIQAPNAEMGQGTYDALAKILVDELDADWGAVEIALSGADDRMLNPLLRGQLTGNSYAVRGYFELMRVAGATARQMLLQAAANKFGVELGACRAESGLVVCGDKTVRYGELAEDASALPVPDDPPLKTPSDWRLIGQDLPRKETQPKIDGTAIYGVDVAEPGMLVAALAMPDEVWGEPELIDDGDVLTMEGVKGVVPVLGGVAVVADDFWTAKSAAELVKVGVSADADGIASTADMAAKLDEAVSSADAEAILFKAVADGDDLEASRDQIKARLSACDRQLSFDYSIPMLAHGALEPLACTAKFEPGVRLTVWAPHQNPRNCHNLAASLTGLPKDKIDIRRTFLGGGFGRKWNTDFVQQAIETAMSFPNTPVKLIWTREQDTQHDFYRPAYAARIDVGLSSDGDVVAWSGAAAGQSLNRTWQGFYDHQSPDPSLQGKPIYAVEALHLESRPVELPTPIGWWRSVSNVPTVFFYESVFDEVAAELNQDPLAFRLRHLKDARASRTLQALQEKAAASPLEGGGKGRGYALSGAYGGYCAAFVDVTMDGDRLTVDHVEVVFDCGFAIEPENVRRQIEGGVLYGLGPTLDGAIELEDRKVKNAHLIDIGALSPFGAPTVNVELITEGDPPSGAGEAGTPVVAPALCNAVFAAGGPRIRSLPISAANISVSV